MSEITLSTFRDEFKDSQGPIKVAADFAFSKLPDLRRAAQRRPNRFPREFLQTIGDLGLLGISVPQEYGGSGKKPYSELTKVMEVFSYESAGHALTFLAERMLFVEAVLFGGNKEQKQEFLPPVISGEKMAFFAVTEKDNGSNATHMKALTATLARKGRNYGYLLNGEKRYITNAGALGRLFRKYETADYGIVAARTSGVDKRGISAFLVDLRKQPEGFTVLQVFNKHGQPGAVLSKIKFDNYFVPMSHRVGTLEYGWDQTFSPTFFESRPRIGVQALAVMKKMIDMAKERASQRVLIREKTVIQMPDAIRRFQLMDRYYEIGKRMIERTSIAKDQRERAYNFLSSLSKLYCTSIASAVGNECKNMFGGEAFTDQVNIEEYRKDLAPMEQYEGPSAVQKRNMENEIGRQKTDNGVSEEWKFLEREFGIVDFNYKLPESLATANEAMLGLEGIVQKINSGVLTGPAKSR